MTKVSDIEPDPDLNTAKKNTCEPEKYHNIFDHQKGYKHFHPDPGKPN